MADNYKILAQTTAESLVGTNNQANVVYTVPASTQASISSVSLINSSVTSQNYYLGVVKATDVGSSITPALNRFVIAANYSTDAAYSADGINWTRVSEAFPGWESAQFDKTIVYGDGKFVAVGVNSSISFYSTDGISWTQATMPANTGWQGLAYGDGKFVAVSNYYTTAAYSADGITWTLGSKGSNSQIESMIYEGGKFIAVGASVFYSTDGIAWSQGSYSGGYINDVAYGDGKFVAVLRATSFYPSSYISAYSDDGISWTLGAVLDNPTTKNWYAITYGNGKFVAVSQGTAQTDLASAAYSTDGINWTQTLIPDIGWQDIIYADGKFLAISGGPTSIYSTDGITWTQVTTPNAQWTTVAHAELAPHKDAILQSQTIIPTRSIEADTVDEIVGGITLSAGDQIRVYSESPDLIVQVYGVEIA